MDDAESLPSAARFCLGDAPETDVVLASITTAQQCCCAAQSDFYSQIRQLISTANLTADLARGEVYAWLVARLEQGALTLQRVGWELEMALLQLLNSAADAADDALASVGAPVYSEPVSSGQPGPSVDVDTPGQDGPADFPATPDPVWDKPAAQLNLPDITSGTSPTAIAPSAKSTIPPIGQLCELGLQVAQISWRAALVGAHIDLKDEAAFISQLPGNVARLLTGGQLSVAEVMSRLPGDG